MLTITGKHKIWFFITGGSIFFCSEISHNTDLYVINHLGKPLKRGRIKKKIKRKEYIVYASGVELDGRKYKELWI